MRGRRRRRRDSTIALVLAAVVVTVALIGFASALSKRSVMSIVFHPSANAPAPAAASYDHFAFSMVWLALHREPALPIHGKAAYLVDVDSRVVLWAKDDSGVLLDAHMVDANNVSTAMLWLPSDGGPAVTIPVSSSVLHWGIE